MYIKNLRLCNFRNLTEREFEFPEGCIVLEGKNGTGKTNLLESIYLLCTGKSQRKASRSEMINFNSDCFYTEGTFFFSSKQTETVSLGYSRDKKSSYQIDSAKITDFSEWFGKRPVLSFSLDDIFLIQGAPDVRRRFFDLTGCFIDSSYFYLLVTYRNLLVRKNALLHSSFNSVQCDLYDEQLALYGTQLIEKRADLIDSLNKRFKTVHARIFSSSERVDLLYEPSVNLDISRKNGWKNVFYTMLCDTRDKDRTMGFSSTGPHRDNIKFLLDSRDAKKYGSQGQCRSMALAVKIACGDMIEQTMGERIIYLVDDSVSELDSCRTENFFPFIENRGQIFVATPSGKLSFKKEYYPVDVSAGS